LLLSVVGEDHQVTAPNHGGFADLDGLAKRWSGGPDGVRLVRVPLAPEIRLLLAADAVVLWARMEAEAGTAMTAPFWASAWLGGQALARFVLDHPDVVAGRRVLDLAAGSGVAGIAAGVAGAAVVTANDIDPYALAAIEANARVNSVEIAVSRAAMVDEDVDVDVVLVGDAFYSKSMAEMALPVLDRALGRGARVLVGDPGRAYLPRDRLEVLGTYWAAHAAAATDAEVQWVHVLQLTGNPQA
jgi:predicted nicotinamide N-methyase